MGEKLYDTDSWLKKPIRTVKEIVSVFDEYNDLHVLDLGCGIGRNSIFIAEKFRDKKCIIDCVDLLEIAVDKLSQNAKDRGVDSIINGVVGSIEEYRIRKDSYDLIMAVSALEHVETSDVFCRKLTEIKDGLRQNGVVCLVINSDVSEYNAKTKEQAEAQFEVNLPTAVIQSFLAEVFDDFCVLKKSVTRQEYDIPREGFISHLDTSVITFVAQKKV